MHLTRRRLLGATALSLFAEEPRYKLGVTTNTRGGWENDTWLAFREAKAAGFDNVETFIHYFWKDFYQQPPEELKKKVNKIGVNFVTISNGAPMEMHFEDASKHEQIVEEHVKLATFVKGLGCLHLKANAGPRRPTGSTPQDLKNMATVYNEIGRRLADIGIRFAPHAHMWSQFENRREVYSILGNTNPKYVSFVLDTGHITMAGMDPVKLARELKSRVVEFHLKDTPEATRGGAKKRVERNDPLKDPVFFALGTSHGVDFEALKDHLDSSQWHGWLTCELDSSPMRPPLEGAKINREYMRKVFSI